MNKNVSARAQAIKEMSREKNRIFRKKVEFTSLLEKTALAWKKKKEMKERQSEAPKKEVSEELSFRETLAKKVVDHDKRKLSSDLSAKASPVPAAPQVQAAAAEALAKEEALPEEDGLAHRSFSEGGTDLSRAQSRDEIGWAQYKPWQKEGDEDEKKKEIPLNTATVVAIRKKLVAMEWARALGKTTRDTRFHDLEQEAATWEQKREEEKRRKEEIRMRIQRHKEVLSEVLAEFAKELREQKPATMDPKKLSALLEESLENAGEVFDIGWQRSGCFIWIEPWEEKKLRRVSDFNIPNIYRVKIDQNFQIASFEKIEDEEIIESLREEILTKPLRESLEEASFDIDNEEEAQQFLEDKLSDIGRLINLERTKEGWLATIESWEEMRLRNVRRKGKPPVVTEEIEINWRKGKLEFVNADKESAKISVKEGEMKTMSLR